MLVVDQFEELYTTVTADEVRRLFIRSLVEATEDYRAAGCGWCSPCGPTSTTIPWATSCWAPSSPRPAWRWRCPPHPNCGKRSNGPPPPPGWSSRRGSPTSCSETSPASRAGLPSSSSPSRRWWPDRSTAGSPPPTTSGSAG